MSSNLFKNEITDRVKKMTVNYDCFIVIIETFERCIKKSSGSFKNVIYKMCQQIIFDSFKNEISDKLISYISCISI